MHLGEATSEYSIRGFPKYDTMLKIANFFGVDVGYLTGEMNAETYTEEKASSYLGLSTDAIKAIKNVTDDNRLQSSLMATPTETARRILNSLLTAKQFPKFIEAMINLASVYEDTDKENQLWEKAEKRFGKALLSEAFDHRDDIGNDNPNCELNEAVHAVNDILDKIDTAKQRNELLHDVFKFQLLRIYNRLIDELYPPYNGAHD